MEAYEALVPTIIMGIVHLIKAERTKRAKIVNVEGLNEWRDPHEALKNYKS